MLGGIGQTSYFGSVARGAKPEGPKLRNQRAAIGSGVLGNGAASPFPSSGDQG